jgi:hypothetical protein
MDVLSWNPRSKDVDSSPKLRLAHLSYKNIESLLLLSVLVTVTIDRIYF